LQFGGDGDCLVEVVGLDQDEAAEELLAVDERAVGQQRRSRSSVTVVADSAGCRRTQLHVPPIQDGGYARVQVATALAGCLSCCS
jgi:hypothetical protein